MMSNIAFPKRNKNCKGFGKYLNWRNVIYGAAFQNSANIVLAIREELDILGDFGIEFPYHYEEVYKLLVLALKYCIA